jgi:hypothetical protein
VDQSISPARPGRRSQEKARRARVKVDLWCDLSGSKGQAVGHVRNLNLGGCRVLSPCAFPKGEVVRLVLQTTPSEPDLHLDAEIRWLGLNPDEGPFELGCRFVPQEEAIDRIERLLRAVIKKTPQAPVGNAAPAMAAERGTLVFASEGLDRLLRPGLSAPLPGSPAAPRAGFSRS